MNNPLTLFTIHGEPRIHDLLLAERLGFSQPRDIRKLIKRHETVLFQFGHRATVARCSDLGNGATRKVLEYYLNRRFQQKGTDTCGFRWNGGVLYLNGAKKAG